MLRSLSIVFSWIFVAVTTATSTPSSPFVWPEQWSAIQEISIVSGNFTGALQRGRIAYDFANLRTREDQLLLRGPSVETPETSNNMTEWFNGSHWFYMDWETMECQSADFGISLVKPDWLIDGDFPRDEGSTYVFAFVKKNATEGEYLPPRSHFERQYINTSWIHVDGSAGFGNVNGSSLFEYYVDAEGAGRRLRMPSTLSADLMVDLQDFQRMVDPEWFKIPSACHEAALRGISSEMPVRSGLLSTLSRAREGSF